MTTPPFVADTQALTPQLDLPVAALRSLVPFPGMVLHLHIGRAKTVEAFRAVEKNPQKLIALLPERSPDVREPVPENLHSTGAVARLKTIEKREPMQVQVEVLQRAVVHDWLESPGIIRARLDLVSSPPPSETATDKAALDDLARELIAISPGLDPVLVDSMGQAQDLGRLTDLLAGVLQSKGSLGFQEAFELLELPDASERATRISVRIREELSFHSLRNRIQDEVKAEMEEAQREYYLKEQLKIIQSLLSGSQENADWGVAAAERRSRRSFLLKQAKAIVGELRATGSYYAPAEEETRWVEWAEAEAEERQSEVIERDQMRVIGSAVTRQIELAQQIYHLELEKKLLERWLTRLEENPETVAGLDLDPSFLERRLRHQRHTTVQRISELEKTKRRASSR